jgi:5-methylcytosine-specific restriction endonuclease McrA
VASKRRTKKQLKGGTGESASLKQLYCHYRYDAKRKAKRPFELSVTQFKRIIMAQCFYCGSPPSKSFKRSGSQSVVVSNGIDRVDNESGYTLSNVVTCCTACNFLKGKMTFETFILRISSISSNLLMKVKRPRHIKIKGNK